MKGCENKLEDAIVDIRADLSFYGSSDYTILEDWNEEEIRRLSRKFKRRGMLSHSSPRCGWLVVEGRQWASLGTLAGKVIHQRIKRDD
jgi:hypothetical protein